MLTDPELRSQVDSLWDKFWTGGLADQYEPPLDMFGADAVERLFSQIEINDILLLAKKIAISF